MALPGFYNQADQDIYESGNKFIPQEQYRLNYTPSTALASTVGNTGGVTGTQAANPYIYPPQGGGGGGGGGFNNKYGLDLSTQKTIDSGKWTGSGYEKTGRKIAKSEGGIWKDVETGQNVYHANIDVKTPMQSIFETITGKKTDGDPYKGTWTGAEWEDDFDESVAHKNLNTYQRWKAKKEFKAAQEKKAAEISSGTTVSDDQKRGVIPGDGGNYQNTPDPNKGAYSRSRNPGGIVQHAQGGRIGYQNGEFVEDVNVEGPGYDENIEMAAGEGEEGILQQLYAKYIEAGFPPDQAEEMAMQEFQQMAMGSEQDQGIASLV